MTSHGWPAYSLRQNGVINAVLETVLHGEGVVMPRLFYAAMALVLLAATTEAANVVLTAPSATQARTKVISWVAAQGVTDKTTLQRVGKAWALGKQPVSASRLHDMVVGTFASIDAKTKAFVESCSMKPDATQPDTAILKGKDAFYSANMRLFYGRYLAQMRMYDEALELLSSLDPKSVVDPAACLYFKAVCEHQLLMKTEGLATINTLLGSTAGVPLRYQTTAELMRHDLQALKKDSLAAISRKMKDVERRLDLGRGGQRVQKEEDEIVASLDAIIEKLEQQGGT